MTVALAAPHPAAVEAGRTVAAAGGTALDAALAAAVMLTVVYPHQCAIGGDLIALVRRPDGETIAVVGAGTAPAAIAEASRGWARVPRLGAAAVTVPGMVAGWRAIAAQGARHPLEDAFRTAAAVARTGFKISEGLARAIDAQTATIAADPGLRALFAPEGSPLGAGDVVVQPALADTLERLAADPADMYTGVTAAHLVAALRAAGGVHTEADFAAYEAEVLPALSRRIDERTWSVAPPPSAGALIPGVVAAAGDADPARLVAASVRGVAARGAHLGDPRAGAIEVDGLLDLDADLPPAARPEARASGDTAAVVAIDDEGWAVTIVQSVYMTFGSGLLDPASGVLLHNRGSAFSMDPASPARLAPGARPPHTLSPMLLDDRDGALVVAGCQGGRAQPWILSQLFAAPDSAHEPLTALLARPRWVVGDVDLGFEGLTLVAEPGVADEVLRAAADVGIGVAAFPGPADEAGHVQLARRNAQGGLDAASDPRADGLGVTVPARNRKEQQ